MGSEMCIRDRDGGGVFPLAASLELGGTKELEDVCRLLAILGQYRRHEAKNECLALLCTPVASALLRPVVSRSLKRIMYPSMFSASEAAEVPEAVAANGEAEASTEDGEAENSGWTHSLLRTLEWTARSLALEAYLPSSVTMSLAGPEATAANLSPATVALLVCLEWASTFGGAPYAAACEATTPPAPVPRATLLRETLGAISLLACDVRGGLHEATLRLGG